MTLIDRGHELYNKCLHINDVTFKYKFKFKFKFIDTFIVSVT